MKREKNKVFKSSPEVATILALPSLVEGENKRHYSLPADSLLAQTQTLFKVKNLVEIELIVFKSGDKLLLTGNIQFQAELICAYCGINFVKEFTEPFKAEYIKTVTPIPFLNAKTVILSSEEIDRTYFQGETVDLLPLLHDTIILAIPLAPRCSEACKGICPGCGANLNIESCQCKKPVQPIQALGRVLSIDFGQTRVGLAISDETQTIAQGLTTLSYKNEQELITALQKIVRENAVSEIVIGNPISLAGKKTKRSVAVENFKDHLGKVMTIPIQLFDERLTSQLSARILSEYQMRNAENGKRKAIIDKLSATIILEDYLAKKRNRV